MRWYIIRRAICAIHREYLTHLARFRPQTRTVYMVCTIHASPSPALLAVLKITLCDRHPS